MNYLPRLDSTISHTGPCVSKYVCVYLFRPMYVALTKTFGVPSRQKLNDWNQIWYTYMCKSRLCGGLTVIQWQYGIKCVV